MDPTWPDIKVTTEFNHEQPPLSAYSHRKMRCDRRTERMFHLYEMCPNVETRDIEGKAIDANKTEEGQWLNKMISHFDLPIRDLFNDFRFHYINLILLSPMDPPSSKKIPASNVHVNSTKSLSVET